MNITLTPLRKLAIGVAVQALILFGLIGFKQYTIWAGETVLLRVQPYDPRDPFRGDYATVRYDISTIDVNQLAGDDDIGDGTAYVELREGADGTWDAVAIHNSRERTFENTVLIKGDVSYGYAGPDRQYVPRNVDYGIEEVFIPESSGDQIPWRDVAVEVKVDRWGNAIARHFVVDGEKLDLERR